ncbi:NhaA family Na+:H+ antiporter [Paraburkholderia sp. HC6.4b]|uniref:Na+/H+ antiporter NhaA n=1 Tax=unclassified Paraburkholderia TaxID=2615204 RepID=UPI00161C38C7|nr:MULTISPECIES: Na+/H+ antiporter NhaA [unclassified Paraburkholderia]MBB5409177.1 NhaA family Na+:H+ antiporter [Paraburkholderia sp. HC6.4b]MBB5450905.1 NhaA family Na+:H+ antiporter [Paraburkholderia sp. Kb1A]
MSQNPSADNFSRPLRIARKAFTALEHFLHVEAASGIILLAAALIALVWANSPFAHGYHALWDLPVTLGVGEFAFTKSVHFYINDALMTVFFLVVGMEIRREIHDGALSDIRQATLPLAAAVGGVTAPAIIFLAVNQGSNAANGWAIPTATDIAFAIGVLALLGRSIPGSVRVFLLTLAIVDDIIAVLIIAMFYSSGLDYSGFVLAAAGIVGVLVMRQTGIAAAPAYIVPGAAVWTGLLISGVHPTLAGVILGLLAPVLPMRGRERVLVELSRATHDVNDVSTQEHGRNHADRIARPLQTLRVAQRELLPPVVRVQWALHPWVAYGIMPLFALANAGVTIDGIDLSQHGAQWVALGVAVALVAGKPLGVFGVTWILVRLKLCRLPADMTWRGVGLIALLAGIGFTMSIFIATLAFTDDQLLNVAKLGILAGSFLAGAIGLVWGVFGARRTAD